MKQGTKGTSMEKKKERRKKKRRLGRSKVGADWELCLWGRLRTTQGVLFF
jgi:hypothetical protein